VLRVAKHSVLYLLRVIKHAATDDSHLQTTFADVALGSEQFVDLAQADTRRISSVESALQLLVKNEPISLRVLERALTESQLTQYRDCCNQPSSFDIACKEQDYPLQFVQYLHLIRQGDRYEALAQSARRRKTLNRTAAEQFSQQAETSYESALMELADLLAPPYQDMKHAFDYVQAELIRNLLDRQVDCSMGNDPNADCVSVPRLKTSRSKYTIKETATTPSKHEHRMSCQCDALIPAALELLYGKQTTSQELTDEQSAKLRQKLKIIRNRDD
jgi:hypothetical protein